jgi:hypothetical protein
MNRSKIETLVVALAVALALALVINELPRMLFPWDYKMFSEAALLTDMLKMTAGQGPHTNPADCNSYIYAPGLQYVTFALLRPLGLQLDIRACRAVCVAIGVASAIVTGGLGCRFGSALAGRSLGAGPRVVSCVIAAGIIFKSYLCDGLHPDNLYGLHAMLLIVLLSAAVSSSRFDAALVAIAFAGLGILVKQTAVLGFGGAAAVLLWFRARQWGPLRSAIVLAWGLAWLGLASYVLLHGPGRFWTMTLVSHHGVEWFRRYWLLQHYTGEMPYRMLLMLTFAPSLLYVAMRSRGDLALQRLLVVWAAIGVTEIAPSLASYFKAWGFWNNLTIIDLWMAVPVIGALTYAIRASGDAKGVRPILALGVVVTFLASLAPTRSWPTHAEYEFGRALDASIARDKAEGRRVFLSLGEAALVHNGIVDVPLDRWSSVSELEIGGLATLTATKKRFDDRYYQKLYLVQTPPPEIQAIIDARYHPVGRIVGGEPPRVDWDQIGTMMFMHDFMGDGARVYEANP